VPPRNSRSEVKLVFLKDDSGVELLLTRLENYSFKMNAQGLPTEEPDDVNDDEV